MKKTFSILIVLFAILANCAFFLPVNAADTVTIIDHEDNEVEVPAEINRIVVADIYPLPSVLAIFFDSAEKLAGIAAPSMTAAKNSLLSKLYPEILSAETGFIDGSSINVEELLKLQPDVVFYSAGNALMGQILRNAGFAAVAVSAGKWHYDAVETLNNWIEMLSQMFPENSRSDLVRQYSAQVYARVRERVDILTEEEKERIFFLFQYNDSTITTSGNNFFGQWWADAVNAVNVGGEMDTNNSTAVSMEQIYAWNPAKILITNFNSAQPETLYNNEVGAYDWSGIDAVRSHQVYKMPLGMYRSYTCGVDTPVTLLWIAKTVYPELFSDIDITAETRAYYREVFGIELTDEQAEMIFSPASEASAF